MNDTIELTFDKSHIVTIGERLGGPRGSYPEAEAAADAVFWLTERLRPLAGPDDLRINLVFDIPGPILPVDYEGVRTGTFSRAKRMLQVQAAVPDELTAADMPGYLSAVLSEMVDAAKGYVKRRKLPLSTEALERAVSKLIARLPA